MPRHDSRVPKQEHLVSDGPGLNPGPRRASARARDSATSYAFLAPFLVIFAVFLVFPVFYSLYLALHQVPADSFDIFGGLTFVGFKNFAKLFADTKFWWSVLMTLYYAALIIPSGIAASLVLALLLNNRLKARRGLPERVLHALRARHAGRGHRVDADIQPARGGAHTHLRERRASRRSRSAGFWAYRARRCRRSSSRTCSRAPGSG